MTKQTETWHLSALGLLLLLSAHQALATGTVTDCERLSSNPVGCSEIAAGYVQMCQAAADENEFCGMLEEELAKCGINHAELSPDAFTSRALSAADFLSTNLLEPEGIQIGMGLCEARDILMSSGFQESSPCTFRQGGPGGLNITINLYPEGSAKLRYRPSGHMFQLALPRQCQGRISGIEYRPVLEGSQEIEAPDFFSQMSDQFGAEADCGRAFECNCGFGEGQRVAERRNSDRIRQQRRGGSGAH